jgi:probable addiction module antidote protein
MAQDVNNDLTPFDAAEYLTEPADHIELLTDAFATGHAGYIAAALGVVARARGMSDLASATGIKRQALYRALSEDGNPTLETMLKVLPALGLRMRIEAAA